MTAKPGKPTWLLALEIVTGVMVGSLFLVALLTAVQRFNNKSSIIIPWKKSASEKEQMGVYIGWFHCHIYQYIFHIWQLFCLSLRLVIDFKIPLQILKF